jgi:hypothetical protein
MVEKHEHPSSLQFSVVLEAKTTNGSDRNQVSVISITLTKEIRSGHSTTSTLGTQ